MKKIEFEIKGLNYAIEDISIKDYYAVKTDLVLNGTDAEFQIISKLSRCPIELLKQISIDDWKTLTFHFNLLITSNLSENIQLVNQFKFKDVEYGLLDWDKMTIGEFADLDVIVNSPEVDNKLHEVLAILYRPIIKKTWRKNHIEEYDYDGFKERSEIFLDAPVYLVKAVLGFFLHIGQVSLNRTKESLETGKKTPEKNLAIKILTALQDNGGLQSFTSQTEIPSKLTELLDLGLKKRSTFLRGNTMKVKKPSWKIKNWLTNITK